MSQPPPVNHIIETVIYAPDLDAARSFYGDVMGLRCFSQSDNHVFFAVGHTVLLVFVPASTRVQTDLPAHGTDGAGHFAIQIDPELYEPWRAHLDDAGVSIELEHRWTDGVSRSIYFRDPAGNAVELVTRPMWEKFTQ